MSENSLDRSDKELDDLLKKISDSADIPFVEEDWNAMEARLNRETKPMGWKTNGLSWGGAILLVGLIGYLVWNSNEGNSDKIPENLSSKATELTQVEKTPFIEARSSPELSEMAKEIVQKIDSNDQVDTSFNLKYTQVHNSNYAWSGLSADSRKDFNIVPSFFSDRNSISALAEYSEVIKSQNEAFEIPRLNRKQYLEENETKEKTRDRFGGKFNLSVQVAPDLSGIKLDQIDKVGNAMGIGIEYFLWPKLSLTSGLFYTYKPYSGNNGYHSGYGKSPTYVFGECDILDIPFNLKFYPFEGKVQRFFASVGLSSYLMLKEQYELEYYNSDTGNPYYQDIEVNGANKHFFGIANISIGYERKLGRQLSIQVEPYYKVPFNGVGEGDVSLKSTGIFVGLKFYPKAASKQ